MLEVKETVAYLPHVNVLISLDHRPDCYLKYSLYNFLNIFCPVEERIILLFKMFEISATGETHSSLLWNCSFIVGNASTRP